MKRVFITVAFLATAGVFFVVGYLLRSPSEKIIKIPQKTPQPKSLDTYYIPNLTKAKIPSGELTIKQQLEKAEKYESFLFEFSFDPALDGKTKITTGQINVPINGGGSYPVVLMIRGYVDQQIYSTGVGTRHAAEAFAQNGYVTIAPDFLGYAGSDSESSNIFESRFQTYTTVLALLQSLDSLYLWDKRNLFIWAHSNGGQVALTSLAITGRPIPTTLWAPVTKPFPYSILYYTDESEDGGELIRTELANLESVNELSKFSFTNYLDQIKAPIQLHQGTADDAVPYSWNQSFVSQAENKDIEIELITHNGADHNLTPDWDAAVEQDLEFFAAHSVE
jgi:dipeptidyl aminopeptidase/acylaminoacyl peptidase